MTDVIHLLPESVANQIAAGEVVQRPASVVKELMENAIDAAATSIALWVKDAGRTAIQVIDNGVGMSDTDARMSFERHATSKIKKTEDLFHIHTKGFRGEALASIAAVAQVELKTKRKDAALGMRIEIEGSRIKSQEQVQCPDGTNFTVKNLFFNVPARRYFLKSDPIEFRHIIDEFQRIALAHPDIEFTLMHNGSEVFKLYKTQRRQRIVNVFGNRYNERLVPVSETTDIVSVEGYIGKPESSRRTRGEQFFFINNRYIKNSYLHHAVASAFEGLLPAGNFPFYVLYLTIDPEQIDINIHPTKTEIKFQDERAIYAILHAAIKHALGKHNITPSIDFNQEGIQISVPTAATVIKQPIIDINPAFNPFEPRVEKKNTAIAGWFQQHEQRPDGWQNMLEIKRDIERQHESGKNKEEKKYVPAFSITTEWLEEYTPTQLFRKYIAIEVESGWLLIDQQRAHRRILFEQYLTRIKAGKGLTQQLLFPEELEISPAQFSSLQATLEDIRSLGFDIHLSAENKVCIQGIPADSVVTAAGHLIENFIEQFHQGDLLYNDQHESVAWAMARSASIKYGQMLALPEMKELIVQLFSCTQPYFSEKNKTTLIVLKTETIDQQFSL